MRRFLPATAAALIIALSPGLAMAQTAPADHKNHTHADHPKNPQPTTSHPSASHPDGNHIAQPHDTHAAPAGGQPGRPNFAPSPWAPNGLHPQGGPQSYNQQRNFPGNRPDYNNRPWHEGDHYDGQREVVNNWRDYHMQPPPHGYEYVRNGDQIVLIAIASGVIADILANALSH